MAIKYCFDLERILKMGKWSLDDTGYDDGYKDGYNEALEDFTQKILNWKPSDEKYRNFKDVVEEIKEELKR